MSLNFLEETSYFKSKHLSFENLYFIFKNKLTYIFIFKGERSERVGDLDRDRERESIFRIRDRRRLDTTLRDEALKSLERDKVEGFTTESLKKGQSPLSSPLLFGEDLQYWMEKVDNFVGVYIKFVS